MNVTANLTSGMVSEVLQDGPESGLTFVFLGVVAGTMIMFLAGTFWAWRKDQEEKEMVRRFLENEKVLKLALISPVVQRENINSCSMSQETSTKKADHLFSNSRFSGL